MRGLRVLILSALALSFVPGAAAQQRKFKDEVLQQYLVPQITDLQAKLDKLTDKLAALETAVAKLQAGQAALAEDLRSTQGLLKATDASVTSLRVTNQQDLLGVKTDLVQIRRDLGDIADQMRRSFTAAPAPAPVAAAPASSPVPAADGYVTQVSDNEVTINLGSAAGMRVGMRFSVYHGSDPQTRIGIIEVTDIIDANNSRARILESKPDTKFQFSDVIRPL
jgi:cell division protein FtsB